MSRGGAPGRAALLLQAAGAAALAVAAAYQVALPVTIDMGEGLLSSRLALDMHAPEAGYRWTRERSSVLVPGPGPFRTVTIEATVSAWRPRGQPLPEMLLQAEGAQARMQATPRPQTARLDATTRGLWNGMVELALASPAVQPSRSDPRQVGVRLHRVRVAAPSVLSPGLPPLRSLLLSMALAAAVLGTALRLRVPPRAARATVVVVALLLGVGHALARAYAVVLLPLALVLAAIAVLAAPALPAVGGAAAGVVRRAVQRLLEAGRSLTPWPAALVAVTAVLGTGVAYAVRPALDLDLGSGREEPFAHGLLAYDADGPVTFRHASGDAVLDLRDLGGGTTWRVEVQGQSAAPVTVTVDPPSTASSTALGPQWSTVTISAPARWTWRPGLRLGFAGEDAGLRIDRVRIDRGRALPSPRVALAVAAATLLLAIGFSAAGCGTRAATLAGLALAGAATAALAADPLLATPLAAPFAAVVAAAAVLCAVGAALAERPGGAAMPAGALAACAVGFTCWLAAPLTPLYRGGHFVFHASIAEEIWQGRLLHYALPYPGSMLSQQAQWGNIVVPHPCLFHVVAAPLAALPRPWFYVAVKAALALWLAGMGAAAALLAQRLAGPRAATYAAIAMAATPAGFQLIGLGHLMTLFGCWAMAMALTFVALRFERLPERRTFWTATALLALCYLSYTAALLFTVTLLALSLPWLWRRQHAAAAALARAAAAGGVAAFLIYYVYWAWPFLAQSVPRILGGSGSAAAAAPQDRALLARLFAQPHKLAYTFGTPLVPLAGLAGLAAGLEAGGATAVLVVAWGAVLLLFGAADLFFNFLLKHHYFTMVPVAVGIGVLLARLPPTRLGRWTAAAALAVMAALAGAVALAVATGRIP